MSDIKKSYWVYCSKNKEYVFINDWPRSKSDAVVFHKGQLNIITQCKNRGRLCHTVKEARRELNEEPKKAQRNRNE